MIMKKIVIMVVLLPIMCYAQFEANMFSTNNQKLIEQAIRSGFILVEQAYQLEDSITHQRFGRYGNDIFGKSRSLGVRVGKDVLVSKSILFPWENDENFERYRASYTPIIVNSAFIELNDTTQTHVVISRDNMINVTRSLISLPDSSLAMKGFTTEKIAGLSKGWLVWITSEKTMQEWDSLSIVPSIYKKTIDFSADIREYEVEALQTSNHIWGGVFIIPKQTQIGQLTFILGGILVKSEDNKWTLESIVMSEDGITQQSDELTPLDESVSGKKNKKKKDKKKKK